MSQYICLITQKVRILYIDIICWEKQLHHNWVTLCAVLDLELHLKQRSLSLVNTLFRRSSTYLSYRWLKCAFSSFFDFYCNFDTKRCLMLLFSIFLKVRIDQLEEVNNVVVYFFRLILKMVIVILFLLIIVLDSQCFILILVLFKLRHQIPIRWDQSCQWRLLNSI